MACVEVEKKDNELPKSVVHRLFSHSTTLWDEVHVQLTATVVLSLPQWFSTKCCCHHSQVKLPLEGL